MSAAKLMQEQLGLLKSPEYSGVSKRQQYYKPAHQKIRLNPCLMDAVRQTGKRYPTYGTRRNGSPDSAIYWDSDKPQAGATDIPQIRIHSGTKEEK